MERRNGSAGDREVSANTSKTAQRPSPAPKPGGRDGSIKLSALIDAYMRAYAGRDTTRSQRLGYWSDVLGTKTLDDISDDDVFAAMDQLSVARGRYFAGRDAAGAPIMKAKRKPLSPATLNRYQAALSATLTWAIRQRMTPKGWHNPCRDLELRPERNKGERWLNPQERDALLSACKASTWPRLYALVLMAITTGARRGELERMRWRDVDFERSEAAVHQSKNGDKKVLPLMPAVVEALTRLQGKSEGLLFPSKRRPDVAYNFDPAWERALKAAGVRGFRFHDLRHTCASYLAQAGAPLLEIASVLGHRQLSVTQRYSHLATNQKAELVGRVFKDIR